MIKNGSRESLIEMNIINYKKDMIIYQGSHNIEGLSYVKTNVIRLGHIKIAGWM